MEADLGSFPPDWRWARVGDLSDRVSVGYVSSTRAYFCPPGEGVPLVRSQNIRPGRLVLEDIAWVSRAFHDANPKSQLRPGDVLVTRVGANAGDVCIVPAGAGEMHLSSAVFARPQPEHRKYIELFFRSSLGQYILKSRIVGSVSERINTRDVEALSIVLPPAAEEAAIAHILGTLDDKIELNRRMSETLEAMARALFKSWFVDFDPVRAKAAGRDPGVPKPLADLFPSRFVDSDLGEIPEGWSAKQLGECVNALSGGTPSKAVPQNWTGDVPWISPKVMTSIHADEAEAHVTRGAIGNGTRLAPLGSTLIMVRGMGLHEGVRVSQVRREVTFNQDVKALVGRSLDPTLLLFAVLDAQPSLLERVESSGHGTGVLPTGALLSVPIVTPGGPVQDRLSQPFRAMNERIGTGRDESRSLAAVRDTLLPKLISGELRVRDAERFVESTNDGMD